MKFTPSALPGVLVVTPRVFADQRGFFFEAYRADVFAAQATGERKGIPVFVQDNHSRSAAGTVRGLHYQLRVPQAKLVRVVRGAIFDVAVDIRRGSPTFGQWDACELSADNKKLLYVPAGFAHGFCALEDETEVEYKCSDYYAADDQYGVAWDDADLAIPWPAKAPILSPKDRELLPLHAERTDLPRYEADTDAP